MRTAAIVANARILIGRLSLQRHRTHVERPTESVSDFDAEFGALHRRPVHRFVVPIRPVEEATGQGQAERMGGVRNHLGAFLTLEIAHVNAILEGVGPVEFSGSVI